MKKTVPTLFLSLVVLLVTAQPISALTIVINNNGSMTLTQGRVLGKDSESEGNNENESREQQRETAKQEAEKAREIKKDISDQKKEQNKELRSVQANEKKQLRIKSEQAKTKVLIERKETVKPEQEQERVTSQEQVETDNFYIEMPAKLRNEIRVETETENENIRRIKEARQQRRDKIEIKTQSRSDGNQEVQLETASIKARLQAAEFVVDPETNQVVITTPSGKVHTLVHLPDQALNQMRQAGLIDSQDSAAQTELSVETNTEGTVIYKTSALQTRQLFGFIPFQVENEVTLEDGSGVVTSTPKKTSFVSRLLLQLSR